MVGCLVGWLVGCFVVVVFLFLFCVAFRRNWNIYVTECIVCVSGYDPLTFSFLLSFLFLIEWELYGPNYLKSVKTCALGQQRPFTPSVPAVWQVVCGCGRCSCFHLRGEPTLFPGWCN